MNVKRQPFHSVRVPSLETKYCPFPPQLVQLPTVEIILTTYNRRVEGADEAKDDDGDVGGDGRDGGEGERGGVQSNAKVEEHVGQLEHRHHLPQQARAPAKLEVL